MENYVQVIGRIAKIKSEQRNNKDFCYLTVACDNGKDKNGEKREADFITADVWDKQASFISQYLVRCLSFLSSAPHTRYRHPQESCPPSVL